MMNDTLMTGEDQSRGNCLQRAFSTNRAKNSNFLVSVLVIMLLGVVVGLVLVAVLYHKQKSEDAAIIILTPE
jgi:uncharacterized membrane protein YoaK (UPF0700 family)